jgi:hypothetical protein
VEKTSGYEKLVRGASVVVGESFPDAELHNVEMRVASKGVVACKGGKRCAEGVACRGLALFVTDPASFDAVSDGSKGWRHGKVKICMTHLKDTEGNALLLGGQDDHSPVPGDQKSQRRPKVLSKSSSGEISSAAVLPPPVNEEIAEGDEEALMPVPPVRTIALKVIHEEGLITMQDVADALNAKDFERMKQFILSLKDENDTLRRQLNLVQQHLISRLLPK